MQFRPCWFGRCWCSLAADRLKFLDRRRLTVHPWIENGGTFEYYDGSKCEWCHRLFMFERQARCDTSCHKTPNSFTFWIIHDNVPHKFPSQFHIQFCGGGIFASGRAVTSLECFITKERDAVDGKAMIYDLRYWRRFSRSRAEKCKNPFGQVRRAARSQRRTTSTSRWCHSSPERRRFAQASRPSTWASPARRHPASPDASDWVRRLWSERKRDNLSS